MDDDNICPICRDDLISGRTKLSCSHYYHYKCILEYAGSNPSNKACPLCSVKIGKIPTSATSATAQPSSSPAPAPPPSGRNTNNLREAAPRRQNPMPSSSITDGLCQRHKNLRTETVTNVQSSPRANTQYSPRANTQSTPRSVNQSNTSGPRIINDEDLAPNSTTLSRSAGTSSNSQIRQTAPSQQKTVQNNPSFLIFATTTESSGPCIIHSSSDDESPIENFTLPSRYRQSEYSYQRPSRNSTQSYNNTSNSFTFGDMLSSLSDVPSNRPRIIHDSSDDD